MAKRKQLHASPFLLSLGLLAVMGFAIVFGVSQLGQKQSSNTQASTFNTLNYSGTCNLTVKAAQRAGSDVVIGESVASSCAKVVNKTVHKTWIHALNTSWNSANAFCTCSWKNGAIISCSPSYCKANFLQSDSIASGVLLRGTYKYRTYGQVIWYYTSGGTGTSGIVRASTDTKITR